MGFFKRLFKIGQAEANSLVDKLEDPIKLTEQGIRDLKEDLDKALKAFAEVKAMSIRSKKEAAEFRNKSQNYERKAMLLIQKTQSGQIDAGEADRLATEALSKKEEADQQVARAEAEMKKFDVNVSKLDQNIKKLKSNVSHYENELKTLKARAKVSAATKRVNKQISQIDSSSTISMLEKMKEKVDEQEALAEAYGDIAGESKSLDDEIDSALGDTSSVKANDALAALKAKMNQQNKPIPPSE